MDKDLPNKDIPVDPKATDNAISDIPIISEDLEVGVVEKYYALINDRIVEGIIVASEEPLSPEIIDQYDEIIEVTDSERPSPGDSYYSDVQTFICNSASVIVLSDVVLPECPNTGTDESFEPFQLSKYSVSYADGMVTIGCKRYSGPGLLNALYKGLVCKQNNVDCFMTTEEGPAHGRFGITWEDAQMLYDALIRINFNGNVP